MAFLSGADKSIFRASSWLALIVLMLVVEGAMNVIVAQGSQDLIVTFNEGTPPLARARTVGNSGAALRFNFGIVNAAAVTVPNPNALAALENDPSVLSVVPDRPVFALQRANKKPDNPGNGGGGGGGGGGNDEVTPSGVTRVGISHANSDGTGIGVAIVDTGIDLLHTDLIVADHFNALNELGSGHDDAGHGTHVAGTVAARQNGFDVIGVAPQATLYAIKVLDSAGTGSDSTLINGLDWVYQNRDKVQVVNMSLGRPGSVGDSPALRNAINVLDQAGIAVVVSAGNDPYSEVSGQVPAAYPEAIAVASSTAQAGSNQCRRFSGVVSMDTASYFTTDGRGVAISAPGESHEDINKGCRLVAVGILSTKLGGGTERKSGTSMAAPHVSGIVARMFQTGLTCNVGSSCAAVVRNELQSTAAGVGSAPYHSPSGAYTFDEVFEGIAQAP